MLIRGNASLGCMLGPSWLVIDRWATQQLSSWLTRLAYTSRPTSHVYYERRIAIGLLPAAQHLRPFAASLHEFKPLSRWGVFATGMAFVQPTA